MQTHDDEGPAWNKFWLTMDHESDSMVSGSQQPHTPRRSVMSPDISRPGYDARDSVLPNESASHQGDEQSEVVEPQHEELAPFPFKFKAPSGRVHRVNVLPSAGISDFVEQVTAKLGGELEAVGGAAVCEDGKLSHTGYALSYLDNEGDTVSITTDQDLEDAVNLARRSHRDKVDLFVHDPAHPPVPVTAEPQATVTKPATPPEEKSSPSEEDRASEEPLASRPRPTFSHAPEEQFISGVPNDLLLPGAIVTLAAVIAGVFILSRPNGR